MSVGTDPAKLSHHLREEAWKGFDFGRGINQIDDEPIRLGGLLRDGVTLVGTPDIVITKAGVVSTGLEAVAIVVNDEQFNDPGGIKAIRPNEGVVVKFKATEIGTYKVAISCDDSEGQVQALEGTIEVKGV